MKEVVGEIETGCESTRYAKTQDAKYPDLTLNFRYQTFFVEK